MVDTILKVLTPATSNDLTTLADMKVMMGLQPTDTTEDAQLQIYITQMSMMIARECNRPESTFGYMELRETVRCLQPNRYYTGQWPIKEDEVESIETPRGSVIDPSTYEIEESSGKIEFYGGQTEPIVVTYWGGYALPDDAPPDLTAICQMCVRYFRTYAMRQAVSGIRQISHKESRVSYFDPNAAIGKQAATPESFMNELTRSLLYHYMRFWV